MGCFVCGGCGAVYNLRVDACTECGSDFIQFEYDGLVRRLLVNLISTITKEQLEEMAVITGCTGITHDKLFNYLKQG